MRIVIVDTGRSRTAAHVEKWRGQLGLTPEDDLALISWNHSRVALPLVDHIVFGPDLRWARREPVRPNITLPRRAATPAQSPPRSRVRRAAEWRLRRLRRALERRGEALPTARLGERMTGKIGNSSPWGQAVRGRLGLKSDGVATDYAIAVARSAQAAELAQWADVVVPFDVRSRKAAWVLSRRTTHPEVIVDMVSAARVIRQMRG